MPALLEREPVSGDEHERFTDLDDGCGCTELWEYLSERRVQVEEGD